MLHRSYGSVVEPRLSEDSSERHRRERSDRHGLASPWGREGVRAVEWLGVGRGRRFSKNGTLSVRYYREARWSSLLERSTPGEYGALCGAQWNGAELDFKAGVPGFQGGGNS